MIVSDIHKFVFIHNPKVGGMTFRIALRPYDTRHNRFFEWQTMADGRTQIDMAHITLAQLKRFFPDVVDQVANYFKFGFVRNPYTRYLSAVSQHLKQGTKHTRDAILSEPELFYRFASAFALEILNDRRIDGDFRLVHFRRQTEFFYLDGQRWANCILKLEEPERIAQSPAAVWLKDAADTIRNRTEPFAEAGYDIAALTSEARQVIATHFAPDFAHFGYETL